MHKDRLSQLADMTSGTIPSPLEVGLEVIPCWQALLGAIAIVSLPESVRLPASQLPAWPPCRLGTSSLAALASCTVRCLE